MRNPNSHGGEICLRGFFGGAFAYGQRNHTTSVHRQDISTKTSVLIRIFFESFDISGRASQDELLDAKSAENRKNVLYCFKVKCFLHCGNWSFIVPIKNWPRSMNASFGSVNRKDLSRVCVNRKLFTMLNFGCSMGTLAKRTVLQLRRAHPDGGWRQTPISSRELAGARI